MTPSLKCLCSRLYNLQGLAAYKDKVPFVLCGNLAAPRISYSKAGKYDNDIFIAELKLCQPWWHHAFLPGAQKHALPNGLEPELAAGNGRKIRAELRPALAMRLSPVHMRPRWLRDHLRGVISDEAATELWSGEGLQKCFKTKGSLFIYHTHVIPLMAVEFVYKLIQIFCFSATLEIQHGYSPSELIISHKATVWRLCIFTFLTRHGDPAKAAAVCGRATEASLCAPKPKGAAGRVDTGGQSCGAVGVASFPPAGSFDPEWRYSCPLAGVRSISLV